MKIFSFPDFSSSLEILPVSLGSKSNGAKEIGNHICAAILEVCPNCKNEVEWLTTGLIAFKLKCEKCSIEFRPSVNK